MNVKGGATPITLTLRFMPPQIFIDSPFKRKGGGHNPVTVSSMLEMYVWRTSAPYVICMFLIAFNIAKGRRFGNTPRRSFP
jgi:hypothetical protein